MKILTHYSSPNYDLRQEGSSPLFLILHYTECDFSEALSFLTDASSPHPVSSHYVIDEDGTIYQLVDEYYRAWHAGASQWKDKEGLNGWSIGIELVHPGHVNPPQPYAQPQMESLVALSQSIIQRYSILPQHVLGHSDIAPHRKVDPGEFFDWQWLARQGVGLWPEEGKPSFHTSTQPSVKAMQQCLKQFGYAIPTHGNLDEETQRVILAFQRHFCPQQLTGMPDVLSFQQAQAILYAI